MPGLNKARFWRRTRLSVLGGGLLASLACAIGCSPWRVDLDADLERSVRQRIRDISLTRLESQSQSPPRSVEEELDSVRERRPPKSTSNATESWPLSVTELRLETLRRNLDLDVIFIDPAIARTEVSEEEAKFDATIFGGARYGRQNPPELDGDLVGFTSDEEELDGAVVKLTQIEQSKESFDVDLGIAVPLPTGGTMELRNVLAENNKLSPQRFEQYVSALKFSFSQPLLRNAGVKANTASIRLSRLRQQEVNAQTKLSAIRVLAGAEKAYWRLYAARKLLEIRAQQYNLSFDNLSLVQKRVKEGLSPQIEIIRAEVGVAQRLESLIIAETNLRLQQRELKRMLNSEDLSLDSTTTIEPTSSPELLRYSLDREKVVADALANRMEMLELELKLAADAIRIDLAQNRALPLFVLDFEYGILDRQGSFGTGWQGMWDFDNSGFAVAVRGEIPVTNEARKSRLERALLARSQRLATRDQRDLAIRQEVYDALDVLDQNWQRILAARQNVVVSGVNYEAELKQFEEGLRTMREVLEALSQLGEAQIRELQAIVTYQVAQIDLAFATGTLLGYAGADLKPVSLLEQYGTDPS